MDKNHLSCQTMMFKGEWHPWWGYNKWKRFVCRFLGHIPKITDMSFGSEYGRLVKCERCGMIGYGEIENES